MPDEERGRRLTIGVLAGWQIYWTARPLSYLNPIFRGICQAATAGGDEGVNQGPGCRIISQHLVGVGAGFIERRVVCADRPAIDRAEGAARLRRIETQLLGPGLAPPSQIADALV